MSRRKGFPRKIVFLITGVLVVFSIGFWLRIVAVTNQKWSTIKKQVNLLVQDAVARGSHRPTISEASPEAGDPWEEYRKALAEIRRFNDWSWQLEAVLDRTGPKDSGRPSLAEVATLASNALEHLRKGVHRESARRPLRWYTTEHVGGWSDEGTLVLAALCVARHLQETHADADALDLLLNTAVFAQDCGDNAPSIEGLKLLRRALNEIRITLMSKVLSPAEFNRVARTLEAIDRGFPEEWVSSAIQVAFVGEFRLQGVPWRDIYGAVTFDVHGPMTPGWRFLFSTRLMEADAFDRWIKVIQKYANASGRSWREMQSLKAECEHLLLGPPANGIASSLFPFPRVSYYRATLAQLRMLRMIVGYCGSGEIKELEDPFGSNLHHSRRTKEVKVWSVGEDGTDHGGNGEWEPQAGRDILLEIK